MERLQGIRPHTEYQYKRQFHVFLAFVLHKKFNTWDNITTVLLFLEFLASNSLSHRVILNYVSALKFAFTSYGWNSDIFSHPLVVRLLRGTALSVHTPPSPNGLFSFYQIRDISSLCDLFESSLTCRCAFLLGFYGLLRISNVAPTSHSKFDSSRQLLRRDVTFAYPGSHIRIKWAKNLQNPERVHVVKLPEVQDHLLCPTKTLKALLSSMLLPEDNPLLVCNDFTLLTQSNIRRRLAMFVRTLGLLVLGYGFHTFHRSGATIAFEANTPLTSVKMHGMWSSDATWSYISGDTSHSLHFPLALQSQANALP